MSGVERIPRASPRLWGRLSRSKATPPVSTPIAAAGQPGYRGGVRSRYSRSMLSPPPSSELATPSWRDLRLSGATPPVSTPIAAAGQPGYRGGVRSGYSRSILSPPPSSELATLSQRDLLLSEATPPVNTPIAAAGQPGYRGGVRSRYSRSMLSPPPSSELATPSRRDLRLSGATPPVSTPIAAAGQPGYRGGVRSGYSRSMLSPPPSSELATLSQRDLLLSEATPPVNTPIAAAGQPGYRGGVRSRYSRSMSSPPPSSEQATPSRRDLRISEATPPVSTPIAAAGQPGYRGGVRSRYSRSMSSPPQSSEQATPIRRDLRLAEATPPVSTPIAAAGQPGHRGGVRSRYSRSMSSPPQSSELATPIRRDLRPAEATPPVSTPIAAADQPGYRGGVRSRYSRSMLSPPPSSELATPSRRDLPLSIDNPWLGERLEFETPVASPMPATRGETYLFRRAEELWKSGAKAREEHRRRSAEPPPPTLEQRLARVREAERAERAKRRPQVTRNDELQRPAPSASGGSATSGWVTPSAAGQEDGAKEASAGRVGGQSAEQRGAAEGGGENERVQEESTGLDRGSVRARAWQEYRRRAADALPPTFEQRLAGRHETKEVKRLARRRQAEDARRLARRHEAKEGKRLARRHEAKEGKRLARRRNAREAKRLARRRKGEEAKRRPQATRNDELQRPQPSASGGSAASGWVTPSAADQEDGAKEASAGREGGQIAEQRGAAEGDDENERVQESTGLDRGSVRARAWQEYRRRAADALPPTFEQRLAGRHETKEVKRLARRRQAEDARRLARRHEAKEGKRLARRHEAKEGKRLARRRNAREAKRLARRRKGEEAKRRPQATRNDELQRPQPSASGGSAASGWVTPSAAGQADGVKGASAGRGGDQSATRTSADSGPGDGTDRVGTTVGLETRQKESVVSAALKAAPETVFDSLDRASTGWIGHDEIETLVGMVGLSYRTEEHGLALSKLCSLRLSRESFSEWYKSTIANERGEYAPGASRVEGSRAGLQQARAVTTSTAVVNATAEYLASTGIQSGADAASSAVPLALRKREAAKFPRDGPDHGSDDEERREERAKAEAAFGKADMLGASTTGSDVSFTQAAFGLNFGGSNASGGLKFGSFLAGAPETDDVAAVPSAGGFLFKKKMGVEEGSTALGRVDDQETLNAQRIASMGDAKMCLLNRKFKTAVAEALEEEKMTDLTSRISDYLTYSERINRSYLADPGQVFTCGNGDCGQLGFGTEEIRDMDIKAPRLLPGLAKQKVVAVLCGGIATAALTENGRVFTWGSSDDGGLGRHSGLEAPEQFPGQVKGDLDGILVVGLDCGDCHMMALDISGGVYGWGCYKDKEGKQWFQPLEKEGAEGAKKASKLPVKIQGLPSDVVEVKCGASFCLALTSKGKVFSWGIGEMGELGREVCAMKVPSPPESEEPSYDFSGIVRDHITPGHMHHSLGKDGAEVVRMEGVKAIGCGEYHSMVVTRGDSDVYTCGLNSYGQLGLGDKRNRKHLIMVEALNGRNTMVVAGGAQHSLVLTTEGLFSFGRNDSGQLGCTERLSKEDWGASETLPMEVHLPVDAGNPRRLKCGTNHCLVMTDKHELYTWGYGETCALGHGSDDDFSLPRKVNTERRGIAKVLDADGGGSTRLSSAKQRRAREGIRTGDDSE